MSLSQELSCEVGSFSRCHLNPTGVFNQWFQALFPLTGNLGCRVYHLVYQLLPCWPTAPLPTPLHNPPPHWFCQLSPCRESSPPGCLSPPLLPVWMNVSSLFGCQTSIQFDFLSILVVFVFKWLLSFFWLCKEAQCVYLCLRLGLKLKPES